MMASRVACLAALTAACGEHRFDLILPEGIEGTDTLLLAITGANSRILVATGEDALYFSEPADASIELLRYTRPIAELPLEAGELRSAPEGCVLVEAVPPDELWAARIEPGVEAAWSETTVGRLSALARTALLPPERCPRDPCPRWEFERFELPQPADNASWSVHPPGGPLIVGTILNRIFAVELDGGQPEVRRITMEQRPAGVRAAALDGAGNIWLGGVFGVSRVRLDGDVLRTERATSGPSGRPRLMGGASSTTGAGLFVLTESGTLERFSGTQWEVLNDALSPVPADSSVRGAIVPVSPGEVLAVWNRDRVVLRYANGALQDETPEVLIEAAAGGALVSGLGPVLVTGLSGQVLHHDGGAWRELGPLTSIAGRGLVEMEGGFFLVADNGQVAPYVLGHGWCPRQTAFESDIRVLERLARDLYVVGGNAMEVGPEPITPMAVLRRIAPP